MNGCFRYAMMTKDDGKVSSAQGSNVESKRRKRDAIKVSNESKMATFCKKQVEMARSKDCDVFEKKYFRKNPN
jgi:hypothetical protein